MINYFWKFLLNVNIDERWKEEGEEEEKEGINDIGKDLCNILIPANFIIWLQEEKKNICFVILFFVSVSVPISAFVSVYISVSVS